jgi:hypothetical protein
MSDAFHYFRSHAVRALCKARAMPLGRIRHLQAMAGRIYHLLAKEAAYSPNLHHMDDFRAAQKLEKSLDSDEKPTEKGDGKMQAQSLAGSSVPCRERPR